MIRLNQRQINHGAFGLLTGSAGLALALMVWFGYDWFMLGSTFICLLISGGFWLAYRRGWEQSRHALIGLLTLAVAFGIPEVLIRPSFFHGIYAIPALALVLTGPGWVWGSALAFLAAFAFRVGGGPYTEPMEVITFIIIVGAMAFSRLAVDNAQRLEEATREAEQARAQAEARERALATQAAELAERNTDQQRLLELVATLETPTIALAEGVLLAPIVGALDSRRAQALTARLLNEVGGRRAGQVILDISGVTAVDTQVAQALIQTARALGLLGCQVTLTGISAPVATTLTQLGVQIEGMRTLRSPQEALMALPRVMA